jgi:VanZ family protein
MRALSRFGPPLALMAVIFFLSAQPDLNSGLGTWDTIGRKIVHMASFGLLWWLWRRALGSTAAAAAITVAFAISDEYHQTFVEGRHGSPVDVLIDTAGMAIAIALHARRRAVARE